MTAASDTTVSLQTAPDAKHIDVNLEEEDQIEDEVCGAFGALSVIPVALSLLPH